MDNLYAHLGWWNEDVFLNLVWNILYSVHDVEINPDDNSWPYQNVDVIGVYYIHVDMFMTLWNENWNTQFLPKNFGSDFSIIEIHERTILLQYNVDSLIFGSYVEASYICITCLQ